MSEILQANIFFFITSVAVVVVTILIGLILFYILGIVRNIKEISERVRRGSELMGRDFAQFRSVVKREGAKAQNIIDFFVSRFTPKRKRASRKKKETE